MNKIKIFLLFFAIAFLASMINSSSVIAQKAKDDKALTITKIELGYPDPGIPFYHFKAKLELPQASIIEVEAAVDGKVLRATDLKREDELEDLHHPPLSERPPSGYSLSLDGTHYKNLTVVGWVKWQPGKDYNIRLTVRMKKTTKPAADDQFLSANRSVKAPSGVGVLDPAWKNYKSVVLSETAGISRINEATEVLLPFYPDEAQQLTRDVRVVAVDPKTHVITEVPSQVYDIQEYLKEDNLAPDAKGVPTRNVPLWMPTVSARVAFLADVQAKTSRVFLVYYNNPDAMVKQYKTDLSVQGEAPGLQIDNDKISIVLHANSGHLDQMTLKSKPEYPLFHRLETNGDRKSTRLNSSH